jgi:hypothetical protein
VCLCSPVANFTASLCRHLNLLGYGLPCSTRAEFVMGMLWHVKYGCE